MRYLASWMTVAVLVLVIALPAGAGARPADLVAESAASECKQETKRLKKFQRGMKAAKRRFFRTHRAKKARKRFVKQQRRKLARLKRARKRCLARRPATPAPAPAPVPAPAPPASGGGGAPPPAPPSGPLTGAPSAPAQAAVPEVVSDKARFTSAEVSTQSGVEYVRTQLELELAPSATVGQVNQLLDRLDATIVSSLKGVGVLTVRIPDPGSLAALRDLRASLAGDPALAAADLATVPVTTELPANIPATDVSPVRPQLASRANGAWNARAALSGITPPTLLITDYFGAGPPGAEAAVQETAADFATGNLNRHGYTMIGLAAGAFDPGAIGDLTADQVTGMWAGPDLPLRVIDLKIQIAASTLEDRLLQMIRAVPGDVVVSTSLAGGCAPAGCTAAEIRNDSRQWITRVRRSGLEGRFVHVVAAGNIYPNLPADFTAVRGSPFIAAAIAPPAPLVPLNNTIVVENTTASDPADGPVRPICLTDTSKEGGHISTVGNDITSFGAPGVPRLLPEGGTSSAAPQAAGAAATLWALDPVLTPAEVVGRLRATAREVESTDGDPRCKPDKAAPSLDAYAAVLAADNVLHQPARAAVLDDDADGDFDEKDLAAFRDAFVASVSDGVVDLDYGRYDLNGDGYTGGGRDRMDLDARSPVQFGFSKRRSVLGLEIGHDENSVRDLDALCHEANGPLYAGDVAARDTFDAQYCLPPVEITVDPAFPSTLQPGGSAPLRIFARRSDLTDPTVFQQPGVHLDFVPASGSVDAITGTTGADGAFATTGRLGPSGDFSVEVIARAGDGGPELDRLTVTAARGAGPVTLGTGSTFIVANAEADDDVEDNADINYSGSVSAADKDATAAANLSSALTQSAGGLAIDANADITASDDGGGGDASAFLQRFFTVTETTPYRLSVELQGSSTDEVSGGIQVFPALGTTPFFGRTTFGSQVFVGMLGPGDYRIRADVGCSPGVEGGTCTGSWTFSLKFGDLATP